MDENSRNYLRMCLEGIRQSYRRFDRRWVKFMRSLTLRQQDEANAIGAEFDGADKDAELGLEVLDNDEQEEKRL